jgi:hypothetical protein
MAGIVDGRRRLGPTASGREGTKGQGVDPVGGGIARVLNVVVGAWVVLSAFLWHHTLSSRTNTWICGLLVVVFSLIALRAPRARFVTTAVAVWLFITSFTIATVSESTVWNNWICAVVIFFISLVPGGYFRGATGFHRPVRA